MGTMDSAAEADGNRYVAVYDSAQFKDLRRRSNTFIAWASVIFYGWWLLVLLLAAFVPDFFRKGLGGPMNVGLLFVLLSLALVVTVSAVYLRFARTRLDPLSERIRADLEGDLR
ncbi:DUF485 domain-containing protein [Streptomyces sp. NPDC047453]|uniref:DUF485 domain-containing protein n=1 Tax=Streptomyces sp. NPDC047453 TaxID=3154812 RepID=UPI00340E7461